MLGMRKTSGRSHRTDRYRNIILANALTGKFTSPRPEVGVLVDAGLKFLIKSADTIYQIFHR